MAGGVVPVDSSPIPNPNGFLGKITLSVVITCIVAASSGLLYGYDLGVSGLCSRASFCYSSYNMFCLHGSTINDT